MRDTYEILITNGSEEAKIQCIGSLEEVMTIFEKAVRDFPDHTVSIRKKV